MDKKAVKQVAYWFPRLAQKPVCIREWFSKMGASRGLVMVVEREAGTSESPEERLFQSLYAFSSLSPSLRFSYDPERIVLTYPHIHTYIHTLITALSYCHFFARGINGEGFHYWCPFLLWHCRTLLLPLIHFLIKETLKMTREQHKASPHSYIENGVASRWEGK